MTNFHSFQGMITQISDVMTDSSNRQIGCNKFFTVENEQGAIVHFVVSPSTYIVDHLLLNIGDHVTVYYDGDAPTILIYPPQYPALVIVKDPLLYDVKVSYFTHDLTSSDGQLKLNLSPQTQMILTNGQQFTHNPSNRDLIVIYQFSTRSIPAQTTPLRIIVLC